jgi:predicted phage tail protein
MKDVRDGGNVDESRFLSYDQRRCLGRWLRALAAICLALTMAGGFTMVASGNASGASAHVLATNNPCYLQSRLSAKATDQQFCLTAKPGDTQVNLTWTPSVLGDNVTVYQGDAQGNGQPATVKDVTVTSALVTGLTNGTTYYFWLVADNTGTPNIVSVTTVVSNTVPATPIGAPGLPTALAATPANGTVTLTWDAPASNGGSPIKGYNVYQGTSPGGETGPVNGTRPIISPYTVKHLTNGTTYYFTVTAVNEAGNSKPSNEVSATPATVPGLPLRLTATPGDGNVTLTWAAPRSDGGSDVTGYNIYYATSADFKAAIKIPWGTGTAVTVTGLVNGTTYYFWVTAVNKAGEGKPSKDVPATPVGAPAAPAGLAATPGDGKVALSWTAPSSDGGSQVTGYNVYVATSADFKAATKIPWGTGTAVTVTGLVNGTTYYFRVTAVNKAGEGKPSSAVPAIPAAAPGVPTGLAAAAGDGQVTLTWVKPASDGGSPLTGYNLSYATSADFTGATVVHGGTDTSLVVNRLVNGTTYYFRVAAVNRVGESRTSNVVKAVPAAAPGAPTGLTATAGDAKVTLTWTAPGSGGAPISGYNVYYATSADFTAATVVHGGTGTSLVVNRLVNGTVYYFRVTAVNRVGEGQRSNEVKAVPVGVPGVPTGLTATAGDAKVTLTWTAPGSGGAPISGYNVYLGTSPSGEAAAPVNRASLVTATSYKVTGLVNGTTYYFRVAAVNRVGEGQRSNEVKAIPVGVPGAPAGLTVSPGDARATLSWTAPGSDGGSPVTGYNIYVATSADFKGATKIPRGTGTAVTVTGLVNGTTYYFRVTAVNRIGAGPASAAAKAVPVTVPGAPIGLSATPGKSKVTLRWAAPPSGGSPITGYIIYKGTSPGGETGPAVNGLLVTATSYAVTSLVNGTPYYFEVFAVNAVGQGSSSNEASATLPPIVPPTSPASTITSPITPAFGGPTGLTATAGDTNVRLSWTAPASDGGSPVTGYKIYVATTPDAQQSTRIVTAKSADATVAHLVNGTTYYFMVTAVNTAGHESPFSTEVSAEPAKLGTQVKVSADSPTVPPQLIALITAAAAMVTGAGFTLIMRGRSRVGSRKRTHSEHSHEAEVGSDVRAVADAGRPDAVSIRDTGQEPTHTIRLEPHPGVSTTTTKEG